MYDKNEIIAEIDALLKTDSYQNYMSALEFIKSAYTLKIINNRETLLLLLKEFILAIEKIVETEIVNKNKWLASRATIAFVNEKLMQKGQENCDTPLVNDSFIIKVSNLDDKEKLTTPTLCFLICSTLRSNLLDYNYYNYYKWEEDIRNEIEFNLILDEEEEDYGELYQDPCANAECESDYHIVQNFRTLYYLYAVFYYAALANDEIDLAKEYQEKLTALSPDKPQYILLAQALKFYFLGTLIHNSPDSCFTFFFVELDKLLAGLPDHPIWKGAEYECSVVEEYVEKLKNIRSAIIHKIKELLSDDSIIISKEQKQALRHSLTETNFFLSQSETVFLIGMPSVSSNPAYTGMWLREKSVAATELLNTLTSQGYVPACIGTWPDEELTAALWFLNKQESNSSLTDNWQQKLVAVILSLRQLSTNPAQADMEPEESSHSYTF